VKLRQAAIILSLLAALPALRAESTPAAAALLTLDQQVESAMVRADTQFLERVLAASFRFNHIGAHRYQTKQQLIEEFGQPGAFRSRTVDDVTVEMHGTDLAITRGRIHFVAGDGNEQTLWYTRLYALRPAGWQLLSHTTISKQQGPPPPAQKK
jgi:hypothetical protein